MSTTLPVSEPILRPPPALEVPRWLSVVSHTHPRYGGLSSAVPRLSEGLALAGPFSMAIAAFCAAGEQVHPPSVREEDITFWPVSRRPWLTSAALRQQFTEEVRRADGVHLHGLWEASTAMGSRTARHLEKPYLVSAHGMLEPWALAQKGLKKKLYAQLVEHKVVANAACLHALTHAEAEQYRNFGAKNPIAVIPNAVEVPERVSAELFLEAFPHLRDRRLILFLGRLHPKKGLDLFMDAWKTIAPQYREAHLVLAGPDAEGTRTKLESAIHAAGLEQSVTFTGMLDSALKWSAFAAAEVFVLPSYSEGLSMGALEAMGAGVPVLVTRNCNMPEVTEYQAGWEIEATVADLTTAMSLALQQSPEQNKVTGLRGSDLITNRYNSRHVAQAMAEVYRYVLNGIPPENVALL